jgi:predicted nucleic acid-binding protein
MTYIDTSCLIKILRPEEFTDEVNDALRTEDHVVVSTLAELESLIELKAGYMAGEYSLPVLRRREAQLQAMRNTDPFEFRRVPQNVWETALRQHRNSTDIHCRALDRLHLAVAELFGGARLMTLDTSQAKAARSLGFQVIFPR